jgi:hypothetical protein
MLFFFAEKKTIFCVEICVTKEKCLFSDAFRKKWSKMVKLAKNAFLICNIYFPPFLQSKKRTNFSIC